jgi:RNA polymerase sigma-70 factor (ECF subfamily)
MLCVQAGETRALQELMTRHEKKLYNFLARYTGDSHLGEDLFQDTFVRVMEKRAKFDPGKGFRSWLYAIAANLARDACRRREVRSRDLRGSVDAASRQPPTPDEEASKNEEVAIVRKVLDELPGDARAIVLLHFYQGLRYREIAEALEVPIGTVKSRMHWAVDKLARVWSEGSANALVGFTAASRKV